MGGVGHMWVEGVSPGPHKINEGCPHLLLEQLCVYIYISIHIKKKCNEFMKLDNPMLRFDFILNFGISVYYTMIDVSIGILLLLTV